MLFRRVCFARTGTRFARKRFGSARESTARHRCREGGLLRRLRGLRRIRRRRGGAPPNDFLGLGSRRRSGGAAVFRGRHIGIRPGGSRVRRGRRTGGGRLLALACGFGSALRFRLLWSRRGCGGRGLGVLLVQLLLRRALVQFLRHTLLEARHAIGENRLAFARQLLLGVEEIEQVGRIPVAKTARAAGQDARQRDNDSGGDQTLRAAHGRFLTQFFLSRQLFATGGSNACSASARERKLGGVSPSLAIRSSHCRAAAVSLARQADSASNSRAVWRKVAAGAVAGSRRDSMLG